MILGCTFINSDGYPVGNVQPTLEEAEEVAKFEPAGWFYVIERDEVSGNTLLLRVYRKVGS